MPKNPLKGLWNTPQPTTYKIVVHLSYRDRQSTYTEVSGLTKREANAYLKERCYTTPSRTYSIEKE